MYKKNRLHLESDRRVTEPFHSSRVSGGIRNRLGMKNYVCVGLGNIPETSGLTSGALSELKAHYILPSDHVFWPKQLILVRLDPLSGLPVGLTL